MNEKQYAFYVLKKQHRSVLDAIEKGSIDDIHVGTYTQDEGRNVSYHGSDLYEVITHIKDAETGEVFHHSDCEERNIVDYVPFKDMESVMEKALKNSQDKMVELQNMMKKEKEKQEHILKAIDSLAKYFHLPEKQEMEEKTLSRNLML